MKKLIIAATATNNAVWLLFSTREAVAFLVDGITHRVGWKLLHNWATANEEWSPFYSTIEAAARAELSFEDRHYLDHGVPMSALALTESMVAATAEDAKRYGGLGDVVLRDQAIRTLDDLAGFWRNGVFLGGEAIVNGLSYNAMLKIKYGHNPKVA